MAYGMVNDRVPARDRKKMTEPKTKNVHDSDPLGHHDQPLAKKPLAHAAERALAEAEARRAAARSDQATQSTAKELGGQKGPEPTRYGDWEKGGIASDF